MARYDQFMNFHEKIDERVLENGILLQSLGHVRHLNVVHWNLPDATEVARHRHPQEQFGFVIVGGFTIDIGEGDDEEHYTLKAGDSYFLPADVPHRFLTMGETEAIDVFSPLRDVESHYN
jgi:quercetin dioxygenase-like cupin family protein